MPFARRVQQRRHAARLPDEHFPVGWTDDVGAARVVRPETRERVPIDLTDVIAGPQELPLGLDGRLHLG